ncbi:MAG: hypothetical protein FWE16_04995 [Firmicutes bacterium]|nr:hypothetical protein [Bacillota bacterium]
MKKKIMGTIAVVTASAILLSACGANSNASAARMADRTAGRAENVIKRIERYDDSKFNFPAHFGNDFFVSNQNSLEQDGYKFQTNTRKENFAKNSNFSENMKKAKEKKALKPNTVKAWLGDEVNEQRYQGKHFDISNLNKSNKSLTTYNHKMEDLYALCADISAANRKQNEALDKIKREASELRSNSKQLKAKGRTKHKTDYTAFNRAHDNAQKAMMALHKDKPGLKREMRMLPKSNVNMNVEHMSKRYMTIMNKLDTRVSKLDAVTTSLGEMNDAMRVALGKVKQEPVYKAHNPSNRLPNNYSNCPAVPMYNVPGQSSLHFEDPAKGILPPHVNPTSENAGGINPASVITGNENLQAVQAPIKPKTYTKIKANGEREKFTHNTARITPEINQAKEAKPAKRVQPKLEVEKTRVERIHCKGENCTSHENETRGIRQNPEIKQERPQIRHSRINHENENIKQTRPTQFQPRPEREKQNIMFQPKQETQHQATFFQPTVSETTQPKERPVTLPYEFTQSERHAVGEF